MSVFKRRIAAGVSAVALIGGGLLTLAPVADAAAGAPVVCDTGSAMSKKTAHNGNMIIELRYNAASRCAWGRISRAQVKNQVWVDRSSNGGSTWTGPMGMKHLESGTGTYTTAFNDAGYVMRACGYNGRTVCTGWY
ncbi:DUF2690 domain-containing protein [Streptomyces sp. H39-S7]|uniref:DUF2690 domain-containing protein n=1 Tax=Streptomyces sp. H39-S7 TaxID=3004357 RepID=UPI0022B04F15|nr:DUF2690 domain-containing protein [Streptomyces sp. H39-S7]MCZ4119692.1 DUF2690 domain-containing protein [Streptomyces sp. H39-S7]